MILTKMCVTQSRGKELAQHLDSLGCSISHRKWTGVQTRRRKKHEQLHSLIQFYTTEKSWKINLQVSLQYFTRSVPPQVMELAVECFNKKKHSVASKWLLVTSQRLGRHLSSPVNAISLLPQIPSNLICCARKYSCSPPPSTTHGRLFGKYFALKILDFETPFFLRISIGLP